MLHILLWAVYLVVSYNFGAAVGDALVSAFTDGWNRKNTRMAVSTLFAAVIWIAFGPPLAPLIRLCGRIEP